MVRTFTSEEKAKLAQIISEGISTFEEIEILQGGLNDTIKSVAESMEIKPAILKKAIKTAQKATNTQLNEDHELLQDILQTVGRTD